MKCICVVMMMMFIHCSSSVEVIGPDPNVPLYAEPGSNILLPCRIEPSTDALKMRVEWFRPDVGNAVVHLYKDQNTINTDQHPSYSGRTDLSMEELQKGNISLLLTDVKVSDHGEYICEIQAPTWNDHVSVKLNVEAVGTDPVITVETQDSSGGATVLCESKGWFPKPELQWLGDEGINLTAGITETHSDGGLFIVKNRVTVPSAVSTRVYCRLKLRHHMKQSELDILLRRFEEEYAAKVRQFEEEYAAKERQLREQYAEKERQLREKYAEKERRLEEEYAEKERQLGAKYAERGSQRR